MDRQSNVLSVLVPATMQTVLDVCLVWQVDVLNVLTVMADVLTVRHVTADAIPMFHVQDMQ
jgi:hypothetical protein